MSRDRMVWATVKPNGNMLHRPHCQYLIDADALAWLSRPAARVWLKDRPLSRSLCTACRPADPRMRVA